MIIDFHTHIFPSFFREKRERFFPDEPGFKRLYDKPKSRLVGTEALLRHMDEEGVQKSVVFGFPWEDQEHFQRHNDYIVESVLRHSDRLAGFCCFAPLSPLGPGETERCLEAGLSGVGELALYNAPLSQKHIGALKDIMAICSRADVPVLIHANEPVGPSYQGKTQTSLGNLYRLVKEYPSNRIVLAHWGGGLFFYALMKKEVKEAFRHTWFDTAASPYLYRPDIYRVAGEIVGFEKILFGSDYPLLEAGRYFKEMASVKLSSDSMKKISGENAAHLLGL